LQAIIDGLSDELVVMDLDFRIVQVNAVVQERWAEPESIISQPCWAVNHQGYPCQLSPHECPAMKVLETGRPARATHFHAHRPNGGRYLDIIASPLRGRNGNIRGVIELFRDVTEEMKVKHMRDRLLKELITAQEEERKRIARELHDETSQALTALAVGLETTIKAPTKNAEQMTERLGSFKVLTGEVLGEIQRIILDLRPAILDDLGLVQAIDWYAESRLKSQGIRIGLETVGEEGRLASEVETTVFRIAQEAITNIARHAGAENVSIELEFTDSAFILNIEDDGYGFDPQKVMAREKGNTSFGLLGMRERAHLFGGTLSVQSQVKQGTRITVEIPLEGARQNGKNTSLAGRRPHHPEGRLESTPQSL